MCRLADAAEGLHHGGVVELPRQTKSNRQVERPDKHAVHALQGHDLLNMLQRLGCFALGQQQGRCVHLLHGLGNGAFLIEAPAILAGGAEATLPDGGKLGVVDDLLHLFHGVDVGHNETARSHVQQLQHGAAAQVTDAAQGRKAAQLRRTHQLHCCLCLGGGVLTVDNDKIKSRASQALDGGGAVEPAERTDGLLAAKEHFFQLIVHTSSSKL